MKRSLYIIGGITLAISMPSHLLAQTTQPKDTTMNRTVVVEQEYNPDIMDCLLYTSPSPRDRTRSRMPSSA